MYSIRYTDRPYLFIVAQICDFVNIWRRNITIRRAQEEDFGGFFIKTIDNKPVVLYPKYKLVRFTGVPLMFSGVWRL